MPVSLQVCQKHVVLSKSVVFSRCVHAGTSKLLRKWGSGVEPPSEQALATDWYGTHVLMPANKLELK